MTRQLHEFRDLIAAECVDVLQPDVALVGGITGLRRVAIMAQEHGVLFTPHTWTNGMGVTANAHLAPGSRIRPSSSIPSTRPSGALQRRDFMLREPLRVDAKAGSTSATRRGWVSRSIRPALKDTRIG